MTVGELKKILEEIPDDNLPILKPSRDHSYTPIYHAEVCDVAYHSNIREWFEYFSDEHMSPGEEKQRALVVGG